MLPGFRFLFAAIVLSVSISVFGLGAAALLRAAHEEFVSTGSWRAGPETMFAQQSDEARPMLAMLSVAPPVVEQAASNNVPAAAPTEPATTRPALPEPTAALQPEESSPPEAGKPDIASTEMTAPSEAAPVPGDALAAAESAKNSASEQTLPAASQAAPAQAEPVMVTAQVQPAGNPAEIDQVKPLAAEPAAATAAGQQPSTPGVSVQAAAPAVPEPDAIAAKIAVLEDPAVTSAPQASAKIEIVRPHRSDRKHQLAHRAARRHRVPQQHARAAPPATPPPADAFTPMIRGPYGG